MLQLAQTEMYQKSEKIASNVASAIRTKLVQNIGIINPQHIEIPLMDLKKYAKTKSASSPLLMGAIDLYENYGGRIQLFDLSTPTVGLSDIPSSIPFVPGLAHRSNSNSDFNKSIPAIFVNLYRMGNWTPSMESYEGISAITDLHACLETGYIAYKMVIDHKADSIFLNPESLLYLTKIYTRMFKDALIKVPGNLPLSDFQLDAANFIIAKFFLVYVMQKDKNDMSVNKLASQAAQTDKIVSLSALTSYEENLNISYETLSQFLYTFGLVFFNGHATSLPDFERAWINIYGEGLAYSIEYVPFLLHFLFSKLHASRLGGSSRLERHQNLQSDIVKLYNAVVREVQK